MKFIKTIDIFKLLWFLRNDDAIPRAKMNQKQRKLNIIAVKTPESIII
jgi:hypothetical protein